MKFFWKNMRILSIVNWADKHSFYGHKFIVWIWFIQQFQSAIQIFGQWSEYQMPNYGYHSDNCPNTGRGRGALVQSDMSRVWPTCLNRRQGIQILQLKISSKFFVEICFDGFFFGQFCFGEFWVRRSRSHTPIYACQILI